MRKTCRRHDILHTLFPVMSGPGTWPFVKTAARVNPSGVMSPSVMVRSVTGPMAASTKEAEERLRTRRVARERRPPMLQVMRVGTKVLQRPGDGAGEQR